MTIVRSVNVENNHLSLHQEANSQSRKNRRSYLMEQNSILRFRLCKIVRAELKAGDLALANLEAGLEV